MASNDGTQNRRSEKVGPTTAYTGNGTVWHAEGGATILPVPSTNAHINEEPLPDDTKTLVHTNRNACYIRSTRT